MINKVEGLPEKFTKAFPYKDRPRSEHLYGVTEVLYCPRKTFLTRVIPAPTAIEFEVRRRFARGHAMEAVFFGDDHNPLYVTGDGDLAGLEGHTDHAIVDDDGKIVDIVEFKSVKKLWHKAPDGRVFYSIKAAKGAVDKSQWDQITRNYNDSHMDQLMMYMMLAGAKNGYLIYYEMSTDENHTWTITSDDITDEFRKKMVDRLNYMRDCFKTGTVPVKNSLYQWECGLCNFNKNGICGLCDVKDFDFYKMVSELNRSGNLEIDFSTVVGKNLQKHNVESGLQKMFVNGEKIGNGSKESVASGEKQAS